jgi:hypothetical protein
MKRALTALLVIFALALGGCATYKPVPDGYSGPTARIADSTYQETGGKGRLYYIESIDGNKIENARSATGQASYGRGFNLSTRGVTRDVPIRKMRLRLIGTHVTAAPIHEIASRAIGEFFSVEGEIDFTPEAGKVYEVRGELTKAVASVWIADLNSGESVSEKIIAK